MLVSSTSFAQTTTSTTGKFTFLNEGDKAPFDGTLFDPAAVAKILAEKKAERERCEIQVKYEKDLLSAICKRNTDILESELRIEKHKNNLIVNEKYIKIFTLKGKEEIEALRNLAKGSNNTLWAVIGFGLGTITSVAIFFAAAEIAK